MCGIGTGPDEVGGKTGGPGVAGRAVQRQDSAHVSGARVQPHGGPARLEAQATVFSAFLPAGATGLTGVAVVLFSNVFLACIGVHVLVEVGCTVLPMYNDVDGHKNFDCYLRSLYMDQFQSLCFIVTDVTMLKNITLKQT